MVAALASLEDDDDDGAPLAVPVARQPAQVYSVRIPLDRIEQLRAFAGRVDTTPSALIRTWVIEKLDEAGKRAGTVVQLQQARSVRANVDYELKRPRHAV
jgi:hypothetical protein